jgi:hypothetical protein
VKNLLSALRIRRVVLSLCLGCITVGCVLFLRLTILSSSSYKQGEEEFNKGQYEIALEHFTWSIRNYYPGNPYVKRSVQRTLDIISQFHDAGLGTREQQTRQRLKAALRSIRSVAQPYQGIIVTLENMEPKE